MKFFFRAEHQDERTNRLKRERQDRESFSSTMIRGPSALSFSIEMKDKRPRKTNLKNVSERRNKIRNLTGKFKSYEHLLHNVEDGQAQEAVVARRGYKKIGYKPVCKEK